MANEVIVLKLARARCDERWTRHRLYTLTDEGANGAVLLHVQEIVKRWVRRITGRRGLLVDGHSWTLLTREDYPTGLVYLTVRYAVDSATPRPDTDTEPVT